MAHPHESWCGNGTAQARLRRSRLEEREQGRSGSRGGPAPAWRQGARRPRIEAALVIIPGSAGEVANKWERSSRPAARLPPLRMTSPMPVNATPCRITRRGPHWRGAHGDANADLARAARNGETDDAVDPETCKHQRQRRKCRRHDHAHPSRFQRGANQIVDPSEERHRPRRIRPSDGVLDCRPDVCRRAPGLDEDGERGGRPLHVGDVHGRFRRYVEPLVPHVFHDADNHLQSSVPQASRAHPRAYHGRSGLCLCFAPR